MERTLGEVLSVLHAHNIAIEPDAEFGGLGLDSLLFLDVVLEIERRCAVQFPSWMMTPETFRSPATIVDAVIALRRIAPDAR
jgi:acyl carrier protein